MYKINLTCVFSLLRRTVYIGFTPFRIFRYLSQKCIPNQNQYGFCTKQEVVVFHGKIAWKPYHTKKNSRLCSIYYTINWNYIICAAIVSWKTWLPLLILNNFFLFLISKFWRPQTTQCGIYIFWSAWTLKNPVVSRHVGESTSSRPRLQLVSITFSAQEWTQSEVREVRSSFRI